MKKLIPIILLGLVLLVSGCTQQPTSSDSGTEWKTWTDPYGYFTIDYPSGWEHSVTVTEQNPHINFIGPTEKYVVTVRIVPAYPDETLESGLDLLVSEDEKEGGTVEIKGDDTLAGLPAKVTEVIYTDPITEKNLKKLAKKGNNFIIFTYGALPESYDSTLPIAEKMADSLKLLK